MVREDGAAASIFGPSTSGSAVGYRDARRIEDAFARWDRGSKGELSRHEARCAFISVLGYRPSKRDLDAMFRVVRGPTGGAEDDDDDAAADGERQLTCDLEHFRAVTWERFALQDRDDVIRHAFRAFDVDQTGYISRARARQVFQDVAPFIPDHVVDQVFDEVDIDQDGRLG